MTTHKHLSNASPQCRIELRPSRWLACALAVIGVFAAVGLFLTNMPVPAAAALGCLCTAWGCWLARSELSRGPVCVVLSGDGSVEVDGARVTDASLHWQGPVTRLSWSTASGRTRIAAWPDVVDAPLRRELRLWAMSHRADASTAAVAP